jgi:hypothetical protein
MAAYFLNPGSGNELTLAYHLCEGHLAPDRDMRLSEDY